MKTSREIFLKCRADHLLLLHEHVYALRVRDVRILFRKMRNLETPQVGLFDPDYGFTLGEFAISYLLNRPKRKS